jgi:hypothetical protein
MLGLGTEHSYYYHITPVAMRKGFNVLSRLVSQHIEQEQGKNVVCAFINKKTNLSYCIGGLADLYFIINA